MNLAEKLFEQVRQDLQGGSWTDYSKVTVSELLEWAQGIKALMGELTERDELISALRSQLATLELDFSLIKIKMSKYTKLADTHEESIDGLMEELAEWKETARLVAAEECPSDEKHCTCVALLRKAWDADAHIYAAQEVFLRKQLAEANAYTATVGSALREAEEKVEQYKETMRMHGFIFDTLPIYGRDEDTGNEASGEEEQQITSGAICITGSPGCTCILDGMDEENIPSDSEG